MATVTKTKPKSLKLNMEKGRRTDVEDEFDERYHVKWSYLAGVPTTAFDVERGYKNQARFLPLDQPTVALYTEAVKRGDSFPAVLAWRPNPTARLVIIDGNHRLTAHLRADAVLDVYEIDPTTDPRVVALMTFAFNTRHGMPTSEKERIHHAVYLIENGASLDGAATAVNLPLRLVKRAMARSIADTRADGVNLRRNEWDSLSAAVKTRLAAIVTDEGFADGAKLAYAAKLTSEEVFDLVALVNATRSGLRQRAIITHQTEVMQDRIQSGGGGLLTGADRRKLGPKQRLALAIAQTLALPEDDQAIAAAYVGPERPIVGRRLRDAATRLFGLAQLIDPREV